MMNPNYIITKADMMNPDREVAIRVRGMHDAIVEAQMHMRELKHAYDVMVERLWQDEPITAKALEDEYLSHLQAHADSIVKLIGA